MICFRHLPYIRDQNLTLTFAWAPKGGPHGGPRCSASTKRRTSLLYSERSLDQDLLDNTGTNCINGTAQYWDNTENNNNNNMRTSSRSSSCNSFTANLEVNNGAAFGHFWGFGERLDASDITSENEERLRYFWRKQRPNTLLSDLKCYLRFQATRRRRHCQCILQQTPSLKI